MDANAGGPPVDGRAQERWRHSSTIPLVGGLFVVTGLFLLVGLVSTAVAGARFFALPLGILVPQGLVLAFMGLLLIGAGMGLLLRHAWGWWLGILIALSGAVTVSVRLIASGGEGAGLWEPLLTDLLVAFLLLRARPTAQAR